MREDQKVAIAALDREWHYGNIFHVSQYNLRVEQILAAPAPAPTPISTTQPDDVHVKRRELKSELDALAGPVEKFITKQTEKTKDINDRLKALEDRDPIRYRGVWTAEEQYNEGEFVTDGGSMWYTIRSTRGRPGKCDDYKLAVKKGRDAK